MPEAGPVIRRCPFFLDLPELDLMAVAEVRKVRALAKGEYLFRDRQPHALARFRGGGSIVVDRKRITLCDPAHLRARIAG
jgi:hypothetical protein